MIEIVRVDNLDDHRLSAYRDIRNRNPIAPSGHFIVESELLVQRLVDSNYAIESILVDNESVVHESWLAKDIPIYCHCDVSSLIGFDFHRGALACGLRKPVQSALDALANRSEDWNAVYLYQVQDPENMGSIFRSCAALGIQNVILGNSCVDPYARRVIRVSMGNSLKLNILRDLDIQSYLGYLNNNGIATIASTLADDAYSLRDWRPTKNWTLFLGNEAYGLPSHITQMCTDRLTIPMQDGVDSLNVSNAASIFLYVLTGAA